MSTPSKIQLIKYAPPPPELPVYGRIASAEVSFFGRTNYVAALEEKKFIFGIKRTDRRHHLYIIGKSGVGKSKLFELLLRQDVAGGRGFCLIDPHGEIVRALLDFIPEHMADRVCLIDPADTEFPVAFNPFSGVTPPLRHQVAQGLVDAMRGRFGEAWTPRIEHVFRFACLALFEYPQATMHDIAAMLSRESFRATVMERVTDESVKRFWTVEFPEWSERFDGEVVMPLTQALAQVLAHPIVGAMLGQAEHKVALESLITGEKFIMVSLAKDILGEQNADFLGSLFVMKLKHAGMARAAASVTPKDFYVYTDEFHHLFNDTFEQLLAGARKFGFCMTLAHQYLGQLPASAKSAVLGNVGSMAVFRIGGQDAVEFEAEMTPVFKAKDMINLGQQQFYAKLMIDGNTYDPFSAETLKVLPPTHASARSVLVAASRARYAVPRK